MKSSRFSCKACLAKSAKEITDRIFVVSNWSDVRGCGPLPGIESAEFEVRTPEVLGSRIRGHNTNGSSHVEEIVVWRPGNAVALQMYEFTGRCHNLRPALMKDSTGIKLDAHKQDAIKAREERGKFLLKSRV